MPLHRTESQAAAPQLARFKCFVCKDLDQLGATTGSAGTNDVTDLPLLVRCLRKTKQARAKAKNKTSPKKNRSQLDAPLALPRESAIMPAAAPAIPKGEALVGQVVTTLTELCRCGGVMGLDDETRWWMGEPDASCVLSVEALAMESSYTLDQSMWSPTNRNTRVNKSNAHAFPPKLSDNTKPTVSLPHIEAYFE